MKFSCEKDCLQSALMNCIRAVPAHAVQDIFKGVLLTASNDSLTIMGNNMEMGIVAIIDADVSTEGSFVLEAKMFSDIVRKLPDDTITISVNEKFLTSITCGEIKFSITALPADNYPALPEVKEFKKLVFSQPILKKQINTTSFAVSESELKIIHTGILFDIEEDFTTLVALDGHRLALSREKNKISLDKIEFVAQATALREVERILSDDEEKEVCVNVGRNHILFDLGGIIIVARLIEGEFLKYKNAIPSDNEIEIMLNRRDFISSVERVSLLISEKMKNPIKFIFKDNKVNVTTLTTVGEANDYCVCEVNTHIEIGFNHRYVLDALKHLESENIRIKTKGSLSACLFMPEDDDNTLCMVLPVRL